MRQIVHIQVGQCGNQIGSKFWQCLAEQHGLDPTGQYLGSDPCTQLDLLCTYFTESSSSPFSFSPRAILTDLQPTTLDNVRAGPYGQLFPLSNYVFGQTGAGNCFPKGHYTDGAEIIDSVLNVTRKEIQRCELLQGIQMMHSMGGGTGSGMGTLLVSKLKEEYPEKMVMMYTVGTSPFVSDCVVEPYNAVLTINQLIENTDLCTLLDNEALYNICLKALKIPTPTYGDLNHTITAVTSGVTCNFRFSNELTVPRLAMELVGFPRMHFLMAGVAPLTVRGEKRENRRRMEVGELTKEMFGEGNQTCAVKPRNGRYLAAMAMYRGFLSSLEVQQPLNALQSSTPFVNFLPPTITPTICHTPQPNLRPLSAISLGNSTAIRQVFTRILQQFKVMYRRKAFLRPFGMEGMDEMEFTEAEINLGELVEEYEGCERDTEGSEEEEK